MGRWHVVNASVGCFGITIATLPDKRQWITRDLMERVAAQMLDVRYTRR